MHKITKLLIQSIIGIICVMGMPACTSKYNNNSTKPNLSAAAGYNIQLALGYIRQGELPRAKEKLNAALMQAPHKPEVHAALAFYLEKIGEVDKAETTYLYAISLEKHEGNWKNNYGAFLCRQNRYKAADKYFMLALKDPLYLNAAGAYENAGLCSMQKGDIKQAKVYFRKAVARDRKQAYALIELSEIAYNEANYDLAKTYLDHYTQFSPATPQSSWLGVRIGKRLDNKKLVKENVERLKKDFPETKQAKYLRGTNIS